MKKNKIKSFFAEVISRVFDPVWEIPIALVLAVVFVVREGIRWRFIGLLLFLDGIVPLIFFLTMIYHGQIKDWDIKNRAQRIPLYLFTLVAHLGGIWLAHELGKTELVSILTAYYLVAVTFFLITLRWKISIHGGVNAVLITTLNYFTGFRFWGLYAVLILVGWARVYQKHHTLSQYVVGVVLGTLILMTGLLIIGN